MNKAKKTAEYIQAADKILALTGAGMSTNSGIPDFRSEGGLYDRTEKLGLGRENVLSHSFFKNNQELAYKYLRKNPFKDAKPNYAHLFLAKLENYGKDITIVTQNIDNLHQEAGSSKVIELHGSIKRWRTIDRSSYLSDTEVQYRDDGIAVNKDGEQVRPDVVLFGESLDAENISKAIKVFSEADLLFILGTSLEVYPAASFIKYFRGEKIIVVNKGKPQRSLDIDIYANTDLVKFFKEVSIYLGANK